MYNKDADILIDDDLLRSICNMYNEKLLRDEYFIFESITNNYANFLFYNSFNLNFSFPLVSNSIKVLINSIMKSLFSYNYKYEHRIETSRIINAIESLLIQEYKDNFFNLFKETLTDMSYVTDNYLDISNCLGKNFIILSELLNYFKIDNENNDYFKKLFSKLTINYFTDYRVVRYSHVKEVYINFNIIDKFLSKNDFNLSEFIVKDIFNKNKEQEFFQDYYIRSFIECLPFYKSKIKFVEKIINNIIDNCNNENIISILFEKMTKMNLNE